MKFERYELDGEISSSPQHVYVTQMVEAFAYAIHRAMSVAEAPAAMAATH